MDIIIGHNNFKALNEILLMINVISCVEEREKI